MPCHVPVRPVSPASRGRYRVSVLLAPLLGGLLLVAFDCASLLHGPGHAHAVTHVGAGPVTQSPHLPAGESPQAKPPHESCSSTGIDDEVEARGHWPARAAFLALAVAPTTVVAASADGAVSPLRHRFPIARSGRLTLAAVCRWRI